MKAAIFEKSGQIREALIVCEWEKTVSERGEQSGFPGFVVFDT